MSLIELHNIRKVYKLGSGKDAQSFIALDDVSLAIEEGEYVAITGPSGSGKSTLLQIIGLLDHSTSGQYLIYGQDVLKLEDDQKTEIRSRFLGFVFQMFNLLPRMTAYENVRLPMVYRGKVDHDKIIQTLNQLGMGSHIHHTPAQMSGGQQQRTAIARALVNSPKVILADEPTGNLPQKHSKQIIEALESLREEGITIIMITHSDELAQRADRIIRIVDGKIESDSVQKHKLEEKNRENNPYQLKSFNYTNWLLLKQTAVMGYRALMKNKARTILTMLGIIIGVFSVVSMMAVGEGAKINVEQELRRIGSNMFRIQTTWPKIKGSASHYRTVTRINKKDYFSIKKEAQKKGSSIKNVSAVLQGDKILSYKGYSYSTKVLGVNSSYSQMRGSEPEFGRFFNESENNNQEKVLVLGKTVYENLFPNQKNPIGETIDIEERKFRVVGLLPSKGTSWGGDIDDVVYIPIETAAKRLFGLNYYHFLYVQAKNEKLLSKAIKVVENILRKNHRIDSGVSNDFKYKNYGEMKQTISKISDTMFKLIAVIALISLIVGGIGIMNIMLVSVIERTREIGIRKAIGARSRDIRNQFLIESVIIGVVGGGIGLSMAMFLGMALRFLLNWEILFKPYAIFTAVSFSVLVGILSGIYPANKAAKLSPINALRYE
ncbi:MAG: ABC transporter permease [Bdellovibrionales bacterium]|nr:ABC transporter permease [Bdellovibrionales bacterium]